MFKKSKEDLKKELSPESYYVTQESGTERPLQVSIGIMLRTEYTIAYAAVKNFLNLKQSLMQGAVGLVFMKQPIIIKLMR